MNLNTRFPPTLTIAELKLVLDLSALEGLIKKGPKRNFCDA